MKNSKNPATITLIKAQNRLSIVPFLDTLCHNTRIYSAHLSAINPTYHSSNLYLFVEKDSFVVVCIDGNPLGDELADEEMFGDELPQYFTAETHRTSPVWKLSDALGIIRRRLNRGKLHLQLHGVLLTSSNILNLEDMQAIWDDMDISVFDKVEELDEIDFPVNPDDSLTVPYKAMQTIEDLIVVASDGEEEEDSFERLMRQFAEESEALSKENEKKEEPEPASSTDTEKKASPSLLWEPTDGIIEQNNNLSVRVKVLPPLSDPRAELEKLVGCKDIKARLDELLALTRYNQLLQQNIPEAKAHEVSLHSLFLGKPGTGKTTVCKIFGSLLHEAGALSKGHVVVADRGTFIGSLWGDEERSVRQVLELAQGGVLMIDEAYLLNGKHDNDPGHLIIQLLMEVLADETQRDIAIVLCGYKEPLMRLLGSNQGLDSRFPNRFEFPDFTVEDLLEISRRRIDEYHYRFTRQAWLKYSEMLREAYRQRNPQSWGNARFVANQLERIYISHAQRLMKGKGVTPHKLLTLTPADIVPIPVPRPAPRIGF